jgi:hypothetical protein
MCETPARHVRDTCETDRFHILLIYSWFTCEPQMFKELSNDYTEVFVLSSGDFQFLKNNDFIQTKVLKDNKILLGNEIFLRKFAL